MENEKQLVVKSDEQKELAQPEEETLTVEELEEVGGGLKRRSHYLTTQPSIDIETDFAKRKYLY